MKTVWSKEQLRAIYDNGKDILVNAGAGSGKTAVLTERILQKIESGVKLNELIVLTFTTLAASEMKERLRGLLKKSNSPYAKEALFYLDQANIQTFDAFTNELVRKYHYVLNISSQINLVDSITFEMVSQDILTTIFDELYKNKNEDFFQLLENYTNKDDEDLKINILKLYDKIILVADYLDILNHYCKYFDEKYIEQIIIDFNELLKEKTQQIFSNIKLLNHYTASQSLKNHYDEMFQLYQQLQSCQIYDDYCFLKNYNFPKIPSKVTYEEEKEPYKAIYENVKKQVNCIQEMLIYKDIQMIKDSYLITKPIAIMISKILLQLDFRLKQYKKEHNAYDFNDIAQMAIKILEENEAIRNNIIHHTKEILIDEYQDTSDIQEKLIGLIGNNNIYMVGDIKQSIYRFRHANPKIFKNKYQKLKENGVIDLSKNFRSRQEVLETINLIFQNLMSANIGGVDYDLSHTLNYGFTNYDNFQENDYHTKIYTYDFFKHSDFSKAEIEAFIIARSIKEMVNKNKIYDKNTKQYRYVSYQDFAILTSSKDKYDLYKQIFEYMNIPLEIFKDQNITTGTEIYVIYNLLKVIYSFYDLDYAKEHLKRSLTGFLRSYVVRMSDENIAKIITSNNILENFEKTDKDLYLKIKDIAKRLDCQSLKTLVKNIYETFDIYLKMIDLYDEETAEYRLLYMYNMIKNLDTLGYTVVDVIHYFNLLIHDENKFNVKMSKKSNMNNMAVKMMSIHASKGLEFPICFFPELYKKFNTDDLKKLFMYSQKYQFIMPFKYDKLLMVNPLRYLEKDIYIKEEISEKIRLLYVALTRPKEQMILVMPEMNNYNTLNKNEIELAKFSCQSFYDLFNLIYPIIKVYEEKINLEKLSLSKDYNLIVNVETTKQDKKNINKKFIDTTLKKRSLTKLKASKNTNVFKENEEITLLNMGKYFHKYLELSNMTKSNTIDFNIPSFIKNQILNFLNSSFIKEKHIINCYHEYAFSYEEKENTISGIIDLILETNEAFYIIDYKLSNINDMNYLKQLSIYKNYFAKLTNKVIYTYLYSIYHQEFKEINL